MFKVRNIMNYLDLINDIDKNSLKNINIIKVRESYLIELAINSLKRDFLRDNFIEINFEKKNFESLNFELFENIVFTLPFMNEKKVFIIDNCDFSKDNISKNEILLNSISEIFKKFNNTTYLFMIDKTNKEMFKGKFYKNVQKYGNIYEINRLNEKELDGFIQKYFFRNKIEIDKKSRVLLIEKLRYIEKDSKKNLYEVENELSKLLNNVKSNKITEQDIENSIIDTFEEKIFGLLNLMMQKKIDKSIYSYRTMKSEDEFKIYNMIIRQIRNMICILDCKNKKINNSTIQSYCGVSQYEFSKIDRYIKSFSLEKLLKLHDLVLKNEILLKTSKKKMGDIIEDLILNFCK